METQTQNLIELNLDMENRTMWGELFGLTGERVKGLTDEMDKVVDELSEGKEPTFKTIDLFKKTFALTQTPNEQIYVAFQLGAYMEKQRSLQLGDDNPVLSLLREAAGRGSKRFGKKGSDGDIDQPLDLGSEEEI